MSKLVTIKLNVSKIPRERIFKGKSGSYIDLDVWVNDNADQYGNDASVNIRQTKEEREAKVPKIYVGNGKTVFGFDSEPAPARSQSSTRDDDDGDDIPF